MEYEGKGNYPLERVRDYILVDDDESTAVYIAE
jgi:hypothetical protein